MKKVKKERTLISISEKSFVQVCCLLLGLLIVSVVLTYAVPKGAFGTLPDGSPDYLNYIRLDDKGGIPSGRACSRRSLCFFRMTGSRFLCSRSSSSSSQQPSR